MSAIPESDLVSLLCELIEVDSPTGKEAAVARLISSRMTGAGFDRVHVDENGNVVGEVRSAVPGKKLLLLTHSDCSPVPPELLPPRAEVLHGEKFGKKGKVVAGPGAAAPKGAIAAMIMAGRALAAGRDRWAGCFAVAVVTKDLLANHDGPREVAQLVRDASLALTAEPSQNNVVVAARGILHLRVTVRGRTGHWGVPDPDGNSIYRAGAFLARLRDIPPTAHPDFGPTGFNPIDLAIRSSPPRLPEWVSVTVDRRVLPGESVREIVETVEGLARDAAGGDAEVTVLRRMYPFQADGVEVESEMLRDVVVNALGREPRRITVKFGSNAAFLKNELGIPSMVLGPGSIDDLGPTEHVEIEQVLAAAAIYRDFALRYLGS
ncbi:MAG: M20/M25/M40 family metallo-hydrolase [Firmicutes bacterium]|jgi:acetylornithine deacetylase/succinyl-diaminopimelate desuccinylase-like protein|nr:M20/M25/M40 family metallo-hydrolase [Bacillota bacterium]